MAMGTLATLPLIEQTATPVVRQVWCADDATSGGKLLAEAVDSTMHPESLGATSTLKNLADRDAVHGVLCL